MKREVDLGDHVLQIEATKKEVEKPLWELVDDATRLAIGELNSIARFGNSTCDKSNSRLEACQLILHYRDCLNRERFGY